VTQDPQIPSDLSRIALSEDYEIAYWTNQLAVSPEELRKVVSQIGENPQVVRDHIESDEYQACRPDRIDPWRP
jgi:hypothetical protein